jgi:hypothetical protein
MSMSNNGASREMRTPADALLIGALTTHGEGHSQSHAIEEVARRRSFCNDSDPLSRYLAAYRRTTAAFGRPATYLPPSYCPHCLALSVMVRPTHCTVTATHHVGTKHEPFVPISKVGWSASEC